ncbi:MAG: hypothetical protein WCD04_11665 [Terriglobia bacterium]|jgi:hypothetical protein
MNQDVTGEKATNTGSARSKHLAFEEQDLRDQLARTTASIAATEGKISEYEDLAAGLAKHSLADGRGQLLESLDRANGRLGAFRDRLEAYKRQQGQLERAIVALAPTEEQTRTRQRHQREFRETAESRLECDRKAERLLEQLRAVLFERGELSKKLAACAVPLELPSFPADLGGGPFANLLGTLPENGLTESEHWYGQFFGEDKDAKSYVVIDETLILPETWASDGICHFGDVVQLDDQQAREFLRDDRPKPGGDARWEFLPASIMALGDYQALAKKADESGYSLPIAVLLMRRERSEAAREKRQQPQQGVSFSERMERSLRAR